MIGIAVGVAYQGTGLAFIWVILERFQSAGGWSFMEVAFLYGMRLTAHGCWLVPLGSLINIDAAIKQGEFDRFLLRPLNVFVQFITTRMSMGSVGDLLVGLALLVGSGYQLEVEWTAGKAAVVVLALLGGALIEGGVYLGLSGLSFRLFDSSAIRNFVDGLFGTFGSLPIPIFPRGLQVVLTFCLPVAFVAYVPTADVLEKFPEAAISWWVSPLLGAFLFTLAYCYWNRQLRNYQSAGN